MLSFCQGSLSGLVLTVGEPPPELPGYRAIEKLGEGGFGEVWRCEQTEPVRRQVAGGEYDGANVTSTRAGSDWTVSLDELQAALIDSAAG